MRGIPAVLREAQIQKLWLRYFTHNFTDRCVRTPDTCRHFKEGVRSIPVYQTHIPC